MMPDQMGNATSIWSLLMPMKTRDALASMSICQTGNLGLPELALESALAHLVHSRETPAGHIAEVQ